MTENSETGNVSREMRMIEVERMVDGRPANVRESVPEPKHYRPYAPEIIDCSRKGCSICGAAGQAQDVYIHHAAVASRNGHYVEWHNLCPACLTECRAKVDETSEPVWEGDHAPIIDVEVWGRGGQ